MKRWMLAALVMALGLSACSVMMPTPQNGFTPTPAPTPQNGFTPTPTPDRSAKSLSTASGTFHLELPAGWEALPEGDVRCQNEPLCFVNADGAVITALETYVGDVGQRGIPLGEYMDMLLEDYPIYDTSYKQIGRTPRTVEGGANAPAEVLDYSLAGGKMRVRELWAVFDGWLLTLRFADDPQGFAQIEAVTETVIESVRIG